MILEFKTKNYKSFVDEAVFSLTAAPKQKGLDYSMLIEKVKGKNVKGLSSSVIYGPNASGKTNIIGAMDTFRAIVLRGNIRNSEEKSSPNPAASTLELIPNNSEFCSEPVLFSIDFTENSLLIHYAVTLDLGCFLDDTYSRKVLKEELYINEEEIFTRENTLSFGNLKSIKNYLANSFNKNEGSIIEISKNSLNDEELFLTNGFKLIFSQNLVKLIIDWFSNKFMVIYRADSMQLIKRFIDPQKKTVYVEKTINNAAKLFGINSNAIGYVVSEDDNDAKLCSIFQNVKYKKNSAMAAEIFESYGTIRFVNMFPLVIRAIMTGGTLVVDEFDASIHPMALMNIINIFHNDDINIHHAQLVFNTHNPIFLNSNLFRRDEIKFVERDEDTHNSVLYALSDFGTTGEKGVRKHEDYMKNYFISQYGAIKDIDFTSIFEELISDIGEV
ncbi:MAG: ATP-binding protein [Sedimentibacter sp.]|uniref:AAA family ATPase n=1 Tax=Sedimentibacter sp. TaxID=1960295 RepID=UPI0029826EE4|nr:ATP-binding protein [Sedimentibacter sp.]MDW5298520.1 ATP-binding protein [Sedimentibacter sp.]